MTTNVRQSQKPVLSQWNRCDAADRHDLAGFLQVEQAAGLTDHHSELVDPGVHTAARGLHAFDQLRLEFAQPRTATNRIRFLENLIGCDVQCGLTHGSSNYPSAAIFASNSWG